MFGIGSMINSIAETAEEFLDDPIGKSYNMATQPLRDSLEVLEGLSEGELRAKAVARLGVDVVAGMAAGEILDLFISEL